MRLPVPSAETTILSDQRGAVIVEGAVVFPVLFLIAFGVFEFSNLFYSHHIITTGIHGAARYLARLDNPASAEDIARNLAVTGTTDGSGPRRVSWWDPSRVSVTVREVPNPLDPATGERRYRAASTVKVVEVRTEVTYAGLGNLPLLGIKPIAFSVSHTERVIGE